jgi:nicotinamidase-related amidase
MEAMPGEIALDARHTAVLIMDYQSFIVAHYAREPQALTDCAAKVLTKARGAGIRIIHVEVRFRPGFPEASPRNAMLSGLKQAVQAGMLKDKDWEIHPAVKAQEGDVVVAKHRVSAFFGSDLDIILRSNEINTLVLFGLITGGVTLGTLLDAFDADYRVIVLKDLCCDQDPVAHDCLVEKIFPRYAKVMTAAEFLAALE